MFDNNIKILYKSPLGFSKKPYFKEIGKPMKKLINMIKRANFIGRRTISTFIFQILKIFIYMKKVI